MRSLRWLVHGIRLALHMDRHSNVQTRSGSESKADRRNEFQFPCRGSPFWEPLLLGQTLGKHCLKHGNAENMIDTEV